MSPSEETEINKKQNNNSFLTYTQMSMQTNKQIKLKQFKVGI